MCGRMQMKQNRVLRHKPDSSAIHACHVLVRTLFVQIARFFPVYAAELIRIRSRVGSITVNMRISSPQLSGLCRRTLFCFICILPPFCAWYWHYTGKKKGGGGGACVSMRYTTSVGTTIGFFSGACLSWWLGSSCSPLESCLRFLSTPTSLIFTRLCLSRSVEHTALRWSSWQRLRCVWPVPTPCRQFWQWCWWVLFFALSSTGQFLSCSDILSPFLHGYD